MADNQYRMDKIIRNTLYVGGLVAIYFLIDYLSFYLLPFFLALVAAYILEPIVKFFRYKLRFKNRSVSVLSTLLTVSLIIFIAWILLIPQITAEFKTLNYLLKDYLKQEAGYEGTIPGFVDEQIRLFLQSDIIKEFVSRENIEKYGVDVVNRVWEGMIGLTGILANVFIIFTFLLYLLFIMMSYDSFSRSWEGVLPPLYRKNFVKVFNDMEAEMKIYFRGQSRIVLILSILFATGFRLIDLPLGIALGIVTGIINFVPYLQLVSIPIALLLAGLSAMEGGTSYWTEAGLVLLVFAVVQGIQEAILIPKIMGNATGINPALILLSLSIFGGLLGLVGMVIALPVTSLIIKYYTHFILHEDELVDSN